MFNKKYVYRYNTLCKLLFVKKKANTVWPKTVPIKTQLTKSQTSSKRPNTGNFLQM